MQQEKQGHLHEARETYRAALACAAGPGGIVLPVGGFPLIRLGNLSREWNDLDAARRDLAQGMELCVQLGQADVLAEAHVMLARLQLARGDHKAVPDTLHKVDQITSRSKIDPWITCWADECRLQRWLSTGHLPRATRWAQASGLAVDGELDYQLDLHHLNLARVLVARGIKGASETDLLGAQRLLKRLLAAARKAGWVNREIETLVLSALALDAQGSDEQALAALEQALVLARPGGYVRTFVDGGAPAARLLRRAVAHRIAPGYADRLLSACAGGSTAQAPPTGAPTQPSALVEPLSDREIEVLALVAQGLSNREIGERLFITQGTVKAHTSNIYGKLGVRSRTQAVAQAQALGIL